MTYRDSRYNNDYTPAAIKLLSELFKILAIPFLFIYHFITGYKSKKASSSKKDLT